MKKYLALFLTMVMGASVLAGCGGSDSAKTFTVGFDAEYPPYGYRTESGDYAGFDLDLAAEERCFYTSFQKLHTGLSVILP